MMNEEQPRWTTFTVSDVKPAEDREGRAQWEISGRWEWTPASNQWGDKIWVYKEQSPEVITKGAHTVNVVRGAVKRNRDGEAYDGSMDWMFKWRVVAWEEMGSVTAPAPPKPTPAPAPAPSEPTPAPVARAIDENQMRIMRQATLKCASWMAVPMVADLVSQEDGYAIKEFVAIAEEMSELFMEYVISGELLVADETADLVCEWE